MVQIIVLESFKWSPDGIEVIEYRPSVDGDELPEITEEGLQVAVKNGWAKPVTASKKKKGGSGWAPPVDPPARPADAAESSASPDVPADTAESVGESEASADVAESSAAPNAHAE